MSRTIHALGGRVSAKVVLRKYRGGRGFRFRIADKAVEERLRTGLETVEAEIQRTISCASDSRVAELAGHVAAAGGKRLRPVLVLLAAEFGRPRHEGVTRAAAAVELIHIASLYHDDVMDAAVTRRGVVSANALWGNRMAVRGGDWLLARAAQLAAGLGQHIVHHNSRAAVRLVEGQLRELMGPGPDEDPVQHYFQVIADKTGELLASSLSLGALQANASTAHVDALAEYGARLGEAFQIADDLIDLLSPSERSGKDQGADLRAGVLSLPVLLARADHSPQGAELRALVSGGPVTDPWAHQRALDLFRDSWAVARTRTMMRDRVAHARFALTSLPPIPARAALDSLCDFVIDQAA
ncbi:polyprenyl synthetase family protein [Streptomyces sp. PU_AKi4]|uniref:polyprenyl synthetase family protein n=1 Tax=Streptomyces sp. PU_AKi4 TaxID=2800809 RepID=UPI0035237502